MLTEQDKTIIRLSAYIVALETRLQQMEKEAQDKKAEPADGKK